MKKLLRILFALILIMAYSIPGSFAEDEPEMHECGDYLYVILDDGTAEIVRYTGEDKNLTIPAELDGIKVTSLGKRSFYHCKSNSVIVPDGINSIKDEAFMSCYFLSSLALPNSVNEIENNPFCGCFSLKEFVISQDHPYLALIKGVIYSKPDKRLLYCPPDLSIKEYMIPKGILEIEDYAFSGNSSLSSITIPDSVLRIGDYAFEFCKSLTAVVIPESVKSIGKQAFDRCESLSSITLQEGLMNIGDYAFTECDALTSLTIPDSVSFIGDNPVAYSDRKEIVISADHPYLEIVDDILFSKEDRRLICCLNTFNKTDYTIPDGTLEIGNSAFENCDFLQFLTIPASVEKIGEVSLYSCKSATLILPQESYAEQYCKEHNLNYSYLDSLDWLND